MSRPNKSLKNDRVICMVPREVLSGLECTRLECVGKLTRDKKIPHMYIFEMENYFVVKLDKCCPCECSDRYHQWKLEKDELRGFLITNDTSWKIMHDTEWY